MEIKLWPGKDVRADKIRIRGRRALVVRRREEEGSAGPSTATATGQAIGQAAGKAPGVLWIHGGGYITGLKEMVYMSRAMELVTVFGAVVISPGYRLAWQRPYPAAVSDCYEALLYMHEHADELGIDRSRIIGGGESAGGGLAAAVCMMARDRGEVKVALQLPLYPMLSNIDTESSQDNHGRIWNTRRNHFGWKLYLRQDAKKTVPAYASPSHQEDYTGLPPAYTFVGDGEPFYRETLDYVENLRKAGVQADVDVYHTNVHAFDMLYPHKEPGRQAIARYMEKVGEYLQI